MDSSSYLDQEQVLHQTEDKHGKIAIKEWRQIRSLYFEDEKRQSSIFIPYPSVLVLHYTQVMMTALLFNKSPKRILLLGLGGGGMAHFLLKAAPASQIDIVELREDVIEIAHTYFKLPRDDERLNYYCADAEQFLNQVYASKKKRYDIIFVDIFNNNGPSSLNGDARFLSLAKTCLTQSGVIAFNLWNRKIDHYSSLIKKYRSIFFRGLLELKMGYLNSNVVVLAFQSSEKMFSMQNYQDEAKHLKQQYGIDFPYFLDLIEKQNFSIFSRLKKLIRLD